MRSLIAAMLVWIVAAPVAAQDLTGLARVDAAQSRIEDSRDGLALTLYLSQAVPYRVFTLDDPRLLILDFREIDWSGVTPEALDIAEGVIGVRFGTIRPGWSRLVVVLDQPFAIRTAEMRVDPDVGTAIVDVALSRVSAEEFAAVSGPPPRQSWEDIGDLRDVSTQPFAENDGALVIALDPGHGGIDPGANRGGLIEAEIMLTFARELSEAINRQEGMRAVLTRQGDEFVPLDARMTIARAAGADALISLHADALEVDEASGVSVYTLSDEASDTASQRMAERHEAGDMLAGVDLSGQDDTVATIMMDLARLETAPAARRLSGVLVTAMRDSGVRLNSNPNREAQLAVLSAPDFPSVLMELGFLSNAGDRARLIDPATRAQTIAAIVQGLNRWQQSEAMRAPLVRQ